MSSPKSLPDRPGGTMTALDRHREVLGAFLGWSARAAGDFGRDVH